MAKYTFIDLFAGCGGLSEGFLSTGKYEGLAHVEWDMPMVNTLRNRLEEHWEHTPEDARRRVVCFDVQKTEELMHGNWSDETKDLYLAKNSQFIAENGIDGLIPTEDENGKKTVDLIIGGPPCQAYSRFNGTINDLMTTIFQYYYLNGELYVSVGTSNNPMWHDVFSEKLLLQYQRYHKDLQGLSLEMVATNFMLRLECVMPIQETEEGTIVSDINFGKVSGEVFENMVVYDKYAK